MPKLSTQKISKRMVNGVSKHGDPGVVWDRDLPGFGVRFYPSGRITYVVQSRGPSGSRRVTLGKHGVITPYQARSSDDRPYQGTRCSRLALILEAGAIQTAASMSTSVQVASRTSPDRAAVRIVNSSDSRVET